MPPPTNSVFRATALARLSSPEQLDERMRVVSPRAWLAFAALGALLLAVALWSVFGRIAVKVRGIGQFIAVQEPATRATGSKGVVFIPANEARRVRAGMTVQLLPATYSLAEDGFVLGIVEGVSERPATRAELREAVADESLAQRLAGSTAMRVDVAVAGPSLPAGLPCAASIVVASEPPIALVLPSLRRAFRQ
jgi:hypothetical protein